MPIISIVSQKGGSGKTTLATHLAVCAVNNGRNAYLIDTDPQATAAAWGDWRGDYLPAVVTSPPARLMRTIRTIADAGGDFFIIDTPPHADAAAREAVKVADLILVPTRLRAFDLHAIEATAELIQYARKPAYVVFNAVPTRASRLIENSIKETSKHGLNVCPIALGERAAFHRAAAGGEVASELDMNSKAALEINSLWSWIIEQEILQN